MRKISGLFILILAMVYSNTASSAVIYSVNRTLKPSQTIYGPPASINGTITTDRTMGFLTPGNILHWDLVLATGPYQVSINPTNSFLEYEVPDPTAYQHGVFATTPDLDFLFTPAIGSFYSLLSFWGGSSVTGDPSLPNYFTWCIGTNFCNKDLGYADELVLIRHPGDESRTVAEYSLTGRENIASTVPLPGGMILLGTAGLLFAATGYCRS